VSHDPDLLWVRFGFDGDGCSRGSYWSAATTYRSMTGPTFFECGGAFPPFTPTGICGDSSHSQPTTWVDIAGGISQSCDDHSTSFIGPLAGEWDGCSPGGTQVAQWYAPIEGINQAWDRWPWAFRIGGSFSTCDIGFMLDPAPMDRPFATVYDLDTCANKQLIGTIYWPDFMVSAQLASGSLQPSSCDDFNGTGQAWIALSGSTGVACSQIENECTNEVCADLQVNGSIRCDWTPPRSCTGAGEYCSAYNNTNDPSCCSHYCYNFRCI
jgi:hypothetical protein